MAKRTCKSRVARAIRNLIMKNEFKLMQESNLEVKETHVCDNVLYLTLVRGNQLDERVVKVTVTD